MHTYKWAKTYIQNWFGSLKMIFNFEPTALKYLYVFIIWDMIIKDINNLQTSGITYIDS